MEIVQWGGGIIINLPGHRTARQTSSSTDQGVYVTSVSKRFTFTEPLSILKYQRIVVKLDNTYMFLLISMLRVNH